MKIVTKLKLAAWAPLLVALIIGVALFFSYKVLRHTQQENLAARRIINGVHELNNFTRSYMIHHEERPKWQFLMEYYTMSEIIAKAHFDGKAQRRYLGDIRRNLEAMRNTFLGLVSFYELSWPPEKKRLREEAEERLAGQILIKSRDSVANALRLKTMVDDEIATTQKRISILIFFLIIGTTIPLAVILLRMTRNIAASFATLRQGTQYVAAGDLNYRIRLHTRDEMGELASVFDLMTERLGQITVSRDELRRISQFPQENPHPVIRCVADGTILYTNAPAQIWLATMGRKAEGRLPEVMRKTVAEAGEQDHLIEIEITNPAGRVFVFFAIRPPDEDYINLYGMDITERKNAQVALRASNERLELLAMVAERLLRAEEPQTVVDELCRKVMRHIDCQFFFNYLVEEPDQSMRLNASAGIPRQAADEIRRLDFGVAVCGCVARDGERIIAEDIQHSDDIRTQLVKSYGVRAYCCHPMLAQGGLIGTLSFGTNSRSTFSDDEVALMKSVTDQVAVAMERLQNDKALRESDERLNLALAAARLGTWSLDYTSQTLQCDECARMHLGLDSSREPLSKFLARINPDDRARIYGDIMADPGPIIGTGRFKDEFRIGISDESERWLMIEALVHFNGSGSERRPFWSVGATRDITDRKRTELELRRLKDELETRVEQRTAELSAANRELEAFSYSVSHDLRAPLRSIDGFSRILLDKYLDRLDERGQNYLSRVSASAQKMGTLIDDMLRLSRIGRAPLMWRKVNVTALAESLVKDLRSNDPRRKIDVEIAPGMRTTGDESLLRIALENLIGNAWKFTAREDTGRIEVGRKTVNGKQAFFVGDNGAGFEMAYVDKLFEPFQRLHAMEDFPGSGIGLTIVKRIVSRHGGEIWAEGAIGEGATIYFTIGGDQ